MSSLLAHSDTVILAGGLGTRLRSVLPQAPKILAPIGAGKTYLDALLAVLARQGAKRVILSLGHLAEQVIAHCAQHKVDGLEIVFSVETEALGTAGALRLASRQITSNPALVMNGDSWTPCDLNAFLAEHQRMQAPLTLLCVAVADASRYGTVTCAAEGAITGFHEKNGAQHGAGLVSAGIYAFSRAALNKLVEMPGSSLEKDFFEKQTLGARAVITTNSFIDIGTPETFAQAGDFFKELL